jgi:hypothetical protein
MKSVKCYKFDKEFTYDESDEIRVPGQWWGTDIYVICPHCHQKIAICIN